MKNIIAMSAIAFIAAGCSEMHSTTSTSLSASAPALASSSSNTVADQTTQNSITTSVTTATTTTTTTVDVPTYINSVVLGNWSLLSRSEKAVSFWNAGNTAPMVQAYDAFGKLLWEKNLGIGSLKSGFDYNADGIPDFVLIKTVAVASCNAAVINQETTEIYSGTDGSLLTSSAVTDRCIPLNGGSYVAYTAMGVRTIQYGTPSGLLIMAPQYFAQGFILQSGRASDTFYTPETSAYDTYVNRSLALQPSAEGESFIQYSQPLHGLVVPTSTGNRYVAFSSGRVLQYSISELSAMQLIADTPFLSDTRLVGRSYGLVQHDQKGNPNHVSVISGTSVHDLYQDFVESDATGVALGHDRWGAIERHVTNYDLQTHAIEQHAFSYAHDNGNTAAYINRITYPSRAYLPSHDSAGSRLVFNVFDGATWSVHISNPGKSDSAINWSDKIVWDIIPRGDDDVDLLVSSVNRARQVYIPNYMSDTGVVQSWRYATYLPEWSTEVYRWSRASESFVLVKTISGAIPYLEIPSSNPGELSSADGMIFPSIRALDAATRSHPVLAVRNASGLVSEVAIDW